MGKKSKNVNKQIVKNKRKKEESRVDCEQQVDEAPQHQQQPMEEESAEGGSAMEIPQKRETKKSFLITMEKPKPIANLSPHSFASVKPQLSDGILHYLKSKSFNTMTPVQAATIPLFLTNKDVAVQAVTGSGKTLAFVIPIVEMILRRVNKLKANQVGAIVLSPTRELAQQTFSVAKELCTFVSLQHPLLLVGGKGDAKEDLRLFASEANDIVVATPGRLEDVLTRYDGMDTSEMEVLVLDEADVLLDMGFDQTLSTILARLPRMRRTGLFSATGTSQKTSSGTRTMKELIKRAGMRNPVLVSVAIAAVNQPSLQATAIEQATPTSLTNYYLITSIDQKLNRLVAFLRAHKGERIIVFFLTCACVEFWGSALQLLLKDSLHVEMLHGKLVQKRREKTMERFRETSGVLFCTDVAARGLDVSDVHWVVQFDAPKEPASYVHRVGRSARAGRTGSSLLFLAPKEESYINLLENRKVPLQPLPSNEICSLPSETDRDAMNLQTNITLDSKGHPLPNVLNQIRDLCLQDRDILEKGTKAFTSYIRAYKEHTCSFIFRFASLDLGLLATSFSLLRLPKMPELRDKKELPNFVPAGPEINIHAIPFKDKVREAARQTRLAAELAAGGKNAKQIRAEQKKAELLQRAKERREAELSKGRNPNKKRGRQAQIFDEWDDLAKEERLYKKLRGKKITEEQYKKMMYGNKDSSTREESASESSVD